MQRTITKPKTQQPPNPDTCNKPICFFCNSTIQPGEEIITRKTTCYHRVCYETLFTLKANQIQNPT